MKHVFMREAGARFHSLLSWAALALMLALTGVGVYINNVSGLSPMFADDLRYAALGMALAAGLLSADAYPADRRAHAERAIYAAPLSSASIFMGKFLASLLMVFIGAVCLALYPVALHIVAPAGGLAAGLCGVLAVFALGVMLTALSTCVSACCRNGFVSFAVYAVLVALIYFMPSIARRVAAVKAITPIMLVLLPALAGVVVWQLFDSVLAGFVAAAVVEIPVVLSHLKGRDFAVTGTIAAWLDELSLFEMFDRIRAGVFDGAALIKALLLALALIAAGIAATMTRRQAVRRAL